MLYAGPVGPTALHAHHAFQIIVGGPVVLRDATGTTARLDGAVLPPHVEHAVVEGGLAVLVYVVKQVAAHTTEAHRAAATAAVRRLLPDFRRAADDPTE